MNTYEGKGQIFIWYRVSDEKLVCDGIYIDTIFHNLNICAYVIK